MQRNCGVLAYDKLVGELNGRANEISMDTLAKLAQDNGFILYPMKVPVDSMTEMPLPCIIYTQHHFQFMEDLADLAPVCMSRKFIYLLTHSLANPDWVMEEGQARQIKGADIGQMFTPPKSKGPWEAMTSGSSGGWAGFAGPSKTTNPNDPKGWGWVGPALTLGSGLIPGVGPLLAAGMGAGGAMGGGTGFQGTDKGFMGNILPTLGGAAGGYGLGSIGAGLGSGLKQGLQWGMANPMMGNPAGMGATQSALSRGLSGFGQGFQSGMGNYLKPLTSSLGNIFGGGGGAAAAGAPNLGGLSGNVMGQPLAGGSALSAGTGATGSGGLLSGIGSTMSNLLGGGGAGGTGGIGGLLGGMGMDFASQLMGIGQQRGGFEADLFNLPEYQRPPELEEFASMIGKAKTELGQMSQDEISRVLSSPIGSTIPEDQWMGQMDVLSNRISAKADESVAQIQRNYNMMGRPNSSEMQQEIAKVYSERDQAINDYTAALQGERIKMEMDYKLTALSAGLGIDQQAAAELAGLTNLSVQEAALKYGLQVEQILQLRQMTMLQEMQQSLQSQQAGYAQQLMGQQAGYDQQSLAQQGDIMKQLLGMQINTGGA